MSTFASSSAASTSSRIQNGTVLILSIANNKAIAVKVDSPPDSNFVFLISFPGGSALISSPEFRISSGLVKIKLPSPPLNKRVNVFWNSLFNLSKVSVSLVTISLSSSSITLSKSLTEALTSSFWLLKKVYLSLILSYSLIAPVLTSPRDLISRLILLTLVLALSASSGSEYSFFALS